MPRRNQLLLAVPALALATACGSTVQMSSSRTDLAVPGSSLSVPSNQPMAPTGNGPVIGPGEGGSASDSSGRLPTSSAPHALPSQGPLAPGTPFDRSPISVGVLDVGDASAFVSAFGFSSGSGPTSQQMLKALVSWFNSHGGLAGKQIKLVEYTTDPTSSSYETEMSAGCARFTQDNHVAVVVSNTGYQMSDNYEACLTKANVPDLNNSFGGLDDASLARDPGLFQTSTASVDSSVRALLMGLTANRFLTAKNHIGILVEACPSNIAAYQHTLAPLAKRLGLNVQRRDFDCVTGAGGMPQSIGQVNASALPFAAAGVDRVLFVSNYQGAAMAFFEKQASSQKYAPSYGLTSYSGAGPSASQVSEDAQRRIKGVGWSPDLDNGRRPPVTGARKRCRSIFASQQLDLGSGTAYVAADALCGAFFALEAALERSHGRTDPASLRAGLETASANPFVLNDTLTFAPARHHAGHLFAPYAFAPACSCFAYTGKPFVS